MKLFLVLISILIIPGTFKGMLDAIIILLNSGSILLPLLIGAGLSVILYYAVIRKLHALNTWEHELTHALVALLFFRKINRFVSSARGGYVQHSGGFGGEVGNVLITLAPYYLPTFTLISALVRPVMPSNLFPWYDGLIGLTLGYHTVSTADEIIQNYHKKTFTMVETNQLTLSDIGKTGLIASAFIIAALTLLIHGVIFNLLVSGYSSLSDYFTLIYNSSIHFINEIILLLNKGIKLITG